MASKQKVQRQFYGTSDIATILGIGQTKARELMYMFGAHGKLFRCGKLLRVPVKDFEAYVKQNTR